MSILKIKDSQGNWVGVPTVKGETGNGISSAVLNNDYTLTLTFTDGTTYKTPSIRGEKGERGEPATDMEIHICSVSEYDAETRIPTIANPNDKTFYLVPTEDGTSPDLFTEWVYVNGAWEMFGSMKIDLSGYLTDVQINGSSIVTDGVANVPIANTQNAGVVKVHGNGLRMVGGGTIVGTDYATESMVKAGVNYYNPVVPALEGNATFYGLAKSAGDTTQSQSSNAVGVYTEDAKSAISEMLGGSVSVSGTTPTIVAKSGIRYVCGEVLSLNFTPSATGICDVMFTSGSTPTVLTLPNTVKMPEWFSIEANTTYEINIADGIYGAVTSWTV